MSSAASQILFSFCFSLCISLVRFSHALLTFAGCPISLFVVHAVISNIFTFRSSPESTRGTCARHSFKRKAKQQGIGDVVKLFKVDRHKVSDDCLCFYQLNEVIEDLLG
jgi:hypothetical protein